MVLIHTQLLKHLDCYSSRFPIKQLSPIGCTTRSFPETPHFSPSQPWWPLTTLMRKAFLKELSLPIRGFLISSFYSTASVFFIYPCHSPPCHTPLASQTSDCGPPGPTWSRHHLCFQTAGPHFPLCSLSLNLQDFSCSSHMLSSFLP